jgi:hypothetical protein
VRYVSTVNNRRHSAARGRSRSTVPRA